MIRNANKIIIKSIKMFFICYGVKINKSLMCQAGVVRVADTFPEAPAPGMAEKPTATPAFTVISVATGIIPLPNGVPLSHHFIVGSFAFISLILT
jgi:hypothetical protein